MPNRKVDILADNRFLKDTTSHCTSRTEKNARLVINGLRDCCQGMKCRLRITEGTLILIDRRLL